MTTPIKIGIIGGSGLNNPDILEEAKEIFVDTPFGAPSDCLIVGKIKGVDCVLLARHGRKHTINPSNVNYRANVWALKEQGCTHIITSTACGSLQENVPPGDLMLLDSFIDRTRTRIQTFFDGSKEGLPGVCHIPMEPAFCNCTRQIILEAAADLGIKIHPSGTAVVIEGPRFSSKAESNLYRSWGAHMVNMTLVPEVVLAKEAGLSYAAIAMATDYDCWREHGDGVCVTDVLATFKKNVEKITKLFVAVVPKIADRKWDDVIKKNKEIVDTSVMIPQEPTSKSAK
ncbi:S-methyl-5'-thioadenosine phosphorylase-like [Homalodisca vitripennis]|uniref:S-methyl-5'-thioadenosine phosphorylase-like n=1 Tax=Homalodisca vitripennis TaxID=197043 RepID=UPI001EEB6C2F|nr:S-methyl-5'-thioadenosine phosphorylase-like [Homalodisca vitripennis]